MAKSLTLLGVGNAGASSLSFNGTSAYMGYNGAGVFNSSTPYWISFWVKGGLQAAGADRRIYAEASSVTALPFITFGSRLTTDNKIAVLMRNDASATSYGGTAKSSTSIVLDNTWHNIIWTDNAGAAQLYVDNTLDATDFTWTPSGSYSVNTVGVGALWRATASSHFNGLVDNVVIGTGTLSAGDRANIFAKTYPASYAQWLFDEGGGSTATDSSGNGRNGTISAATYSTDAA